MRRGAWRVRVSAVAGGRQWNRLALIVAVLLRLLRLSAVVVMALRPLVHLVLQDRRGIPAA